MRRTELNDLAAFATLADAKSFTRAAGRLGMSPSALSHAISGLEERLGVQLLARTTRSVAPTEAGDRLLAVLRPALDDIASGLAGLSELRDKPAGTLRITAFRHAATMVLWPLLPAFLARFPDIRVEVQIDDGLTDIVSERFDAGLRWGDKVAGDMVAIRLGPAIRFAVVGSPAYLAAAPALRSPRDLGRHRCIGYRLKSSGALYAWEFEKGGRRVQVRPEGPVVVNDESMMLEASLAGLGLSYVYENQLAEHLAAGRLVRVLADWCPSNDGYYLYHPKKRFASPALSLLIQAMRAADPAQPHS